METILAFVGFVVVAGFVYFKFVKKKKIAVSVDGKPVVTTSKQEQAPTIVAKEEPMSVNVSGPRATTTVSASGTVHSLLDQLGSNWKAQEAFAAKLTQRQCLAGEIAFHNGEKYTPTVADTYQLVNDDPDHRLTSADGALADTLHYHQGNLLIGVMKAQKAAGLVSNKGAEIMDAAKSGDYSKIRGA